MSPESLLAEKLSAYRSTFDDACRGLFASGEGVTLEYEHDDDDDAAVEIPAAAAVSERAFENSNGGSNVGAAAAARIRAGVRSIAEDFAHEFNGKLALAARNDPTVELVAGKYEMGPEHVAELEALLARPVAPLLAKIAAGDFDGARRATLAAWPLLERTIRSKWQAYFVLTFQDVSVERKAARDRRKLQPRFDEPAMIALADAQSKRHAMVDFAADADERPRGTSPWIAVLALLLLAAAGGWFLLHHHVH
jgi:hypothetical protein